MTGVGRVLMKAVAIILYLAVVWTLREIIHEAWDPARQPGAAVTRP